MWKVGDIAYCHITPTGKRTDRRKSALPNGKPTAGKRYLVIGINHQTTKSGLILDGYPVIVNGFDVGWWDNRFINLCEIKRKLPRHCVNCLS